MVTMEPVPNPVPQCLESNYKMTEEDVKRLIEFRASNEALFTGKRNSAKIAWSTILKGLGLEGKLTADQIAKKWDNLRTKYKDLKQPYQGQDSMEGVVESWPWFHIMENAMQGRLYNRNLVLSPEIRGGSNNNNNNIHIINSTTQLCNQNQENADILEFLIKTEMEDSVAAAADDRKVVVGPPSFEGAPLSWRRMSECSYKMTEPETERMIKLRAANEALFTGRKNSAKPAWRAILHELGLQGKLTTEQLSKKWDNMKRRYKELRFPAPGVETNPGSWPWFYRMGDALEGRLASAAPVLLPLGEDGDDECEPLSPAPRKRPRRSRRLLAEFLTESEIDLLVENQERNGPAALGDLHRLSEFTYKLSDDDTRRLIELRAANESLFTGRRNSAKPAWRGIVKKMGLAGRITPDQVAKKWDNLKTKYKDLKFPPRGMEGQTNPASWPWFQLMSDALEGRLAGKAPRVAPSWSGEEDNVFGSSPPADRDCLLLAAERCSVSELESVVGGDSGEAEGNLAYTDASGEEGSAPSDPSYKMTDLDTRRMIKLRAANETLFTGRRNTAKAAWKAILKELGLLGKVSTYQMAKKWDNLKRRYKDLRFPPAGMESSTDPALSWPWFHLMNEAMEGRLAHSGRLLSPVTQEDEDQGNAPCTHCSCSAPPPPPPPPPLPSLNCKQEALANGGTQKHLSREACEAPLGVLGQEWEEVARERAALKREREMVERERASLERERAALQAERLWLEQERAALEQRALMLNSVGHPGHLSGLM